MRRLRACVLSVAVMVAPSARAATHVFVPSDVVVRDAGTGVSMHDAVAAFVSARWSAEGDEPFALDEAWLTSLGEAGAASEHNPFAWTLLLIVFAGLTAFFAGKRSGGRGLIGA